MFEGIFSLIKPITDAVNSIVDGINKPITQREIIRQNAETSRVSLTQRAKTIRTVIIAAMSFACVYIVTLIFLKNGKS